MFSSYETARQVADQLVAIAAHYDFEGWLVRSGCVGVREHDDVVSLGAWQQRPLGVKQPLMHVFGA